jgi:hypothetical protein
VISSIHRRLLAPPQELCPVLPAPPRLWQRRRGSVAKEDGVGEEGRRQTTVLVEELGGGTTPATPPDLAGSAAGRLDPATTPPDLATTPPDPASIAYARWIHEGRGHRRPPGWRWERERGVGERVE